MDDLRSRHRDYIRSNLEQITFGGLASENQDDILQVCICLDTASISDAELFVRNDPYREIYTDIEIMEFRQMIPGIITA